MADLAVIILTHNEAIHIERAIKQLATIAKEIFVVDSFSNDETAQIAQLHGAVVLRNRFINYSAQFQWALDNAPLSSEWVMRLDADEVIELDLIDEIARKLPLLPPDVVGVNLKRKHIFLDRWIRFGGRYPLVLLRMWRRGHGRIEQRWMDEHIVVWGGRTTVFEGCFSDHNLNGLTFFIDKHNKYATREAIDVLNYRLNFFQRDERLTTGGTSAQASIKRFVKEKLYNRIPFPLAALSYFLFRYVVQLGFLDGKEGLIYHFLQGFWYRFLVGAKVMEFQSNIGKVNDPAKIRSMLRQWTGLEIDSKEEGVNAGRTDDIVRVS